MEDQLGHVRTWVKTYRTPVVNLPYGWLRSTAEEGYGPQLLLPGLMSI